MPKHRYTDLAPMCSELVFSFPLGAATGGIGAIILTAAGLQGYDSNEAAAMSACGRAVLAAFCDLVIISCGCSPLFEDSFDFMKFVQYTPVGDALASAFGYWLFSDTYTMPIEKEVASSLTGYGVLAGSIVLGSLAHSLYKNSYQLRKNCMTSLEKCKNSISLPNFFKSSQVQQETKPENPPVTSQQSLRQKLYSKTVGLFSCCKKKEAAIALPPMPAPQLRIDIL